MGSKLISYFALRYLSNRKFVQSLVILPKPQQSKIVIAFIVYLCRAHKMRSYGIQKYNIKSLQTCQNVKNMSSRCLRLQ